MLREKPVWDDKPLMFRITSYKITNCFANVANVGCIEIRISTNIMITNDNFHKIFSVLLI